MSKTQRIVAYDALRVFAIVTVVAIHTLMPYRNYLPDTAPVRIFDDLLHYAVPLFVFISGVFVWGRDIAPGWKGYSAFLSRRVSVVVVPFLAWSALYMVILAIRQPSSLTPMRAVGLLLTGHTWYHLYFIPMLLTFYLLTPVATRIRAFSPELLVAGCYALRILGGPEIASLARTFAGDLGWAFATHVVIHLPHMALGAWFAVRQHRLPRSALLIAALLVGGTAVLYAASTGMTATLAGPVKRLVFPVGMAATVLGLALGALRLEPAFERHTNTIVSASALAFGVYFVHPLFLLSVDGLIARLSAAELWNQAWFPLIVFAGVTAASFATASLLARTPLACRLVGFARPASAQGRRTR